LDEVGCCGGCPGACWGAIEGATGTFAPVPAVLEPILIIPPLIKIAIEINIDPKSTATGVVKKEFERFIISYSLKITEVSVNSSTHLIYSPHYDRRIEKTTPSYSTRAC